MEAAYVLVKTAMNHETDVINEILKVDEVKEVKGTFGIYDVFVKIQANSSQELEDMITKHIRKTKYVLSTMTLSVIPESGKK